MFNDMTSHWQTRDMSRLLCDFIPNYVTSTRSSLYREMSIIVDVIPV